jgi:hypothetical protein
MIAILRVALPARWDAVGTGDQHSTEIGGPCQWSLGAGSTGREPFFFFFSCVGDTRKTAGAMTALLSDGPHLQSCSATGPGRGRAGLACVEAQSTYRPPSTGLAVCKYRQLPPNTAAADLNSGTKLCSRRDPGSPCSRIARCRRQRSLRAIEGSSHGKGPCSAGSHRIVTCGADAGHYTLPTLPQARPPAQGPRLPTSQIVSFPLGGCFVSSVRNTERPSLTTPLVLLPRVFRTHSPNPRGDTAGASTPVELVCVERPRTLGHQTRTAMHPGLTTGRLAPSHEGARDGWTSGSVATPSPLTAAKTQDSWASHRPKSA